MKTQSAGSLAKVLGLALYQISVDWAEDRAALIARILVLGIVISMTRFFALTNLFEFFLLLLCLINQSLRKQILQACRDPRVALVFIFWSWVLVACLWGQAPPFEKFQDWWSWRKLILVPICFVLFRREIDKYWLAAALFTACSAYMILSWLGYFNLITLDRDPTQLLENHSTQGVLFSAACIFGFFFARESTTFIRIFLVALSIGFLANISFLSTGRAGYLFLVVSVLTLIFLELKRNRILLTLISSLLLILFVASSETARTRINQGFVEILNVNEATEMNSVGFRIIAWQNTLTLISNKPILGSGSGSFRYDYGNLINPSGTWIERMAEDPSYNKNLGDWRLRIIDDPHQQYLHIFAEYGLFGFLIFVAMLFSWIFYRTDRNNFFANMAVAFVIGTAANGLFNGHFSAFVEGRFLWIFLSAFMSGTGFFCAIGPWRLKREQPTLTD